jgi:endonuclease-3
MDKNRVGDILKALHGAHPEAHVELRHDSPLHLLIATILSAQCTDERVNQVTPPLFRAWPDARALASAPLADLESAIRSTGFFRAKARSITSCCQALLERHAGEVPRRMEELVKLPGVGRKTANVVLGTAFGIASGVVVDTHVFRITHRLGLTRAKTPEKVELDLMKLLPREEWINFSHRVIHHGRQVCMARNPQCPICRIEGICPKLGVSSKNATKAARR